MAVLRTVGHGVLEAAHFAELVRHAGVELVVDVRRFPALRNEQFRAYADHMATAEFAAAVAALRDTAAGTPVAVMCAEAVWWRCHRRLLADHLVLVESLAVEHLFHDGRLTPHPPTPEARKAGHHLVYDLTADQPLFPEG
jgi:uncharacterized protein (DUF488 family)